MRRVLLAAAACLASTQPVTAEPVPGLVDSSRSSVAPTVALGTIRPFATFANAQVASGGLGLRNRRIGSIEVSGAPTPARAAYLYWAVITNGPLPAAARTVRIQRRAPLPISGVVSLTGVVVGTGSQPCWAGTTITVVRANVPTTLANGSGSYEVQFPAAASSIANGGDPWFVSRTPPLLEGASLVIVGAGNTTVGIYDRGMAGRTFSTDGLAYTLALPAAYTGGTLTLDNIGADGQIGESRIANAASSREVTRVNGTPVAGPGSPANDSDWNGAIAGPLPQLWDNTSHNIQSAVASGATAINVAVSGTSDCLTPVANVIGVR